MHMLNSLSVIPCALTVLQGRFSIQTKSPCNQNVLWSRKIAGPRSSLKPLNIHVPGLFVCYSNAGAKNGDDGILSIQGRRSPFRSVQRGVFPICYSDVTVNFSIPPSRRSVKSRNSTGACARGSSRCLGSLASAASPLQWFHR